LLLGRWSGFAEGEEGDWVEGGGEPGFGWLWFGCGGVVWREGVAAEEMEDFVSVGGRGRVVPGETRLADALVLLAGHVQVAL
jgi:hypothetical protein